MVLFLGMSLSSPCSRPSLKSIRDFDAPTPTYADTSAAMVIVNGLLILAESETDPNQKQRWIDTATQLLNTTTTFSWKPSWQSLLSNGTANVPSGIFNTGIVYGTGLLLFVTIS